MTKLTTIKVPEHTRDLVRDRAEARDMTQAQFIEFAVEELERREWYAQVAAFEPDDDYLDEMREWDRAAIGPGEAR